MLNSGKGSKEILLREVIFKLNVEVCQGDRKKRPFLAEKKTTYKDENKRQILMSSKTCHQFAITRESGGKGGR